MSEHTNMQVERLGRVARQIDETLAEAQQARQRLIAATAHESVQDLCEADMTASELAMNALRDAHVRARKLVREQDALRRMIG